MKKDAQHRVHSAEGGDSNVQAQVAVPSAQHCSVSSESHPGCVQQRDKDVSSANCQSSSGNIAENKRERVSTFTGIIF